MEKSRRANGAAHAQNIRENYRLRLKGRVSWRFCLSSFSKVAAYVNFAVSQLDSRWDQYPCAERALPSAVGKLCTHATTQTRNADQAAKPQKR